MPITYFIEAFGSLFTPSVLLISCFSAFIGVVLGLIPGLSGGLGMMLMLPITFFMDPVTAMALLISMYVGGVSGGFMGSVLLGIPGAPSSIATVYDGYEFTKKGDPVPALSAGTVANFLGTFPSIIIAAISCQFIARWAIKLGPWEFFSLGLCAIVMIASLSKGNLKKGLLGAGIALMLATIGRSPVSGTIRFTFGNYHLAGGLPLIGTLMGIFAGRTIMLEYIRGERMSNDAPKIQVRGFDFKSIHLLKNTGNIIRSFFIGLGTGFLPGLGSALANVTAYAMAKNASKEPEKFGTGEIAGVWAPEVANNASVGGAIIPMIALGIPGDGVTALLLSGLTIQGIEAGPLFLRNYPSLAYMIFAAALFGAVFVLILEIFGMKLFPMFLRTPYHFLYSVILVLCLTGAFVGSGNLFSVFLTIIFTLIGMWMSYADIPTTPFVLTFILGSMLEKNFRNGISFSPEYGIMSFLVRPVSAVLLFLALLLLFYPMVKDKIAENRAKKTAAE